MAWSPDSKTLVTGAFKNIYIWDIKVGPSRVRTFSWLRRTDDQTGTKTTTPTNSHHEDSISSIQWMPDGSAFLASSMDCKLVFYVSFVNARTAANTRSWLTKQGPTGTVRRAWSFNTLQITDFLITPDQKSIIAGTTSLKRVTAEAKLKQSVSSLDAENTAGLPRDFGYGSMEHNIVVIRLGDKEITE